MTVKLDDFVRAYLVCALWSSTGDDDEPLDRDHDLSDISDGTIAEAIEDCTAFRESAGDMLAEWSDEQAGHDFWLTRNGHGAGFWDRGRKFGDELSDLARPFGDVYLYVGDDGKVYS
jgi:hypothetical protein